MTAATMQQSGSDTEQDAPVHHNHPRWQVMITKAIEALDNGKKGSSIKPIKDYIVDNYDLGDKEQLVSINYLGTQLLSY